MPLEALRKPAAKPFYGCLIVSVLGLFFATGSLAGHALQSTAVPSQQSLVEQAFLAAKQTGTAAGWESFLRRYPTGKHTQEARQALDARLYDEALLVASDPEAVEAIFHRCKTPDGADKVFLLWETASYRSAEKLGTADAYHRFLHRFPKGEHHAAAESALDDLAWQPCANKVLAGCRAYLQEYPEGGHAKDARDLVEETEFEAVKAEDTIAGYKKYLDDHSGGGDSRHQAVSSRLRELIYNRAVASDTLADWIKFDDEYHYEDAAVAQVANARKEIERLMYAEIVAGSTLEMAQDYLSRFPDGSHVQQVQAALDPLLFAHARKKNTVDDYEEYLKSYPQGDFAAQARTLLDPILFAKATKEDWHTAYEEYLQYCPTGANAAKSQQRIAFLKANPAVPAIHFPAQVVADNRWAWNTVFRETGGKTGFKVSGSGHIVTSNGDEWGTNGGSIARNDVTVRAGGSGADDYWASSDGNTFCGADAEFDWTGEDAGGNPIHLEEKVHFKCSSK
jgi:TolA-binding protein